MRTMDCTLSIIEKDGGFVVCQGGIIGNLLKRNAEFVENARRPPTALALELLCACPLRRRPSGAGVIETVAADARPA